MSELTPIKTINGHSLVDTVAREMIANLETGTSSDTIPSYWQTHLDERVVDIREAMAVAGWNKSAFLWYHDAHWTYNYQKSPMLLKYLYKHTSINKTFFGGDIVDDEGDDSNTMSYLWDWRAAIRDLPNHHSVPGNHDDGNSPDNRWDDAYIYNFLLAAEETSDMIRGDALYYYIDNPSEKTRYICLDTATKDGNILNDATEEAWLKETLLSTPANWHIVAIAHIWLNVDYDVNPPVATGFSYGGKICLDMFDAYNARTGDYANCTGKVEFCIGGHSHVDADYTSTGGIPVILTECDCRNVRGEFTCTEGTVTEASVNAIIADYTNGKVNVIRIGRGNSRTVKLDGSSSDSGDSGDTGDSGETEDTTWMTTSITRTLQTSDDTVAIEWADNVDGVTYVVYDNGTEVASVIDHTQTVLFNVAAGSHSYTVRPQKSDSEVGNHSASVALTTLADVGFTNVLRTAVGSDGTLYNRGLGYKENTRISSSDGTEKTATGWDCTGYIPITRGDVVRLRNMDYYDLDDAGGTTKRNFVCGFAADYTNFTVSTNPLSDAWSPVLDDDGDLIQFTMVSSWTNDKFIRITGKNIDAFSIITVNEEINV